MAKTTYTVRHWLYDKYGSEKDDYYMGTTEHKADSFEAAVVLASEAIPSVNKKIYTVQLFIEAEIDGKIEKRRYDGPPFKEVSRSQR